MTRRVQRIAAQVSPRRTTVSDGFPVARHFPQRRRAPVARVRRRIGLDPAFTIHDRENSADLMNLVRHELTVSPAGSAFP